MNIFDRDELNRLAKESKFVQRSTSGIDGFDFVLLLAIVCMPEPNISLEGLCDCLTEINPEAEMKPQSLSDRINSEYSRMPSWKRFWSWRFEKNLEHVRKVKSGRGPWIWLQPRVSPGQHANQTVGKAFGNFQGKRRKRQQIDIER